MEIVCSGCGKKIPVLGAVCPYCGRDKSDDVSQYGACIVFGIIGCVVGNWLANISGLLVGGFIGVVLGFAMSRTKTFKDAYAQNAEKSEQVMVRPAMPVREVGKKHEPSSRPKPSTEERLANLKELLQKGFLSQSEYDEKRKAIVDEL